MSIYDSHPVSTGDYVKALAHLENKGIVGQYAHNKKSGWAVNKALCYLYRCSTPTIMDDVASHLGYSGYKGCNGVLGNYFANPLRNALGHDSHPPYDSKKNYIVKICSFVRFINGVGVGLHFVLHDNFRKALDQQFGRKQILSWQNLPKPR